MPRRKIKQDPLQLHERIFAQVLGIQEGEKFSDELSLFAKELLYILPPGYIMTIGEAELAGIPMFVEEGSQDSYWNHPYEEEMRRKVDDMRSKLIDERGESLSLSTLAENSASNVDSNSPQSSKSPPRSARSFQSDLSLNSMKSLVALEEHEVVFGRMLGIDLDEPHSTVLLYFAKELMYILPEGWEMLISSTNSGAKIPYFFDKASNTSSWTHPYQEQYFDLVRNNRQQLVEADQQQQQQINVIESNSLNSSPRSSLHSLSPRGNLLPPLQHQQQLQRQYDSDAALDTEPQYFSALAESSRGPALSKLEIVEIQFAVEALGVDLQEEFAADLLDFARELLQILPENWEFVIAEADDGSLFPLFLNTTAAATALGGGDGEPLPQLQHPLAQEHRESVAEVRHVLTYGELPPDSQLQQQQQLENNVSPSGSPSAKFSAAVAAQRVLAKSLSRSVDAVEVQQRAVLVPPLHRQPSVRVSTPPVESRGSRAATTAASVAVRVVSPTADVLAMNASKKEKTAKVQQWEEDGDDSSVISDITANAAVPAPPATTPPVTSAAAALRSSNSNGNGIMGRDNTHRVALSFEQQVESTAGAVVSDWVTNGIVTHVHQTPKHKQEKRPRKHSQLHDVAVEPVFNAANKSFSVRVIQQTRDGDSDSQHSVSTENSSSNGVPLMARQPSSHFLLALNNINNAAIVQPAVNYLESGSFEGYQDEEASKGEDNNAAYTTAVATVAQSEERGDDAEVVSLLRSAGINNSNNSSNSSGSSGDSQRPSSRQMLAEMQQVSFRNTINASISMLEDDDDDNSIDNYCEFNNNNDDDGISIGSGGIAATAVTATVAASSKSPLDEQLLAALGVDGAELQQEIDDTSESVISKQLDEPDDDMEQQQQQSPQQQQPRRVQFLEDSDSNNNDSSQLSVAAAPVAAPLRFQRIDVSATAASNQFSFINSSSNIIDEDDGIDYGDDAEIDGDTGSVEHFKFPPTAATITTAVATTAATAVQDDELTSQLLNANSSIAVAEEEVPIATPAVIPPVPPGNAVNSIEKKQQQLQMNNSSSSNSSVEGGERRSSRDVIDEFHSLFKKPSATTTAASGSSLRRGVLQPKHSARPSASFVLSVAQGNSIRVTARNLEMLRSSKSSGQLLPLQQQPQQMKGKKQSTSGDLSDGSGSSSDKRFGIAICDVHNSSSGGELQPLRKISPKRLRNKQQQQQRGRLKWHLLSCYAHYNQALTARKIIERLVVADSKGTIVFDPRLTFFEDDNSDNDNDDNDIHIDNDNGDNYDSTPVAVSTTGFDATTGSTSVRMNSSSYSSSSSAGADFKPSASTNFGTTTAAITTQQQQQQRLPAATDTAELILGRVKRSSERLSKLRVRKDLGRMQWVVETDDAAVLQIANRRKKKKGINLENDNGATLAVSSAATRTTAVAALASNSSGNGITSQQQQQQPPRLPPVHGPDAIKKAFARSKTFGVIAKMRPSGDPTAAKRRLTKDGREVPQAVNNSSSISSKQRQQQQLQLMRSSSHRGGGSSASSSLLAHFNLMKGGKMTSNSAGDSTAQHLNASINSNNNISSSSSNQRLPKRHIYSS